MCGMVISNLTCECCGSKFPIPRKRTQRRPDGHIKHLWCIKCKIETAHVEIRNNIEETAFIA